MSSSHLLFFSGLKDLAQGEREMLHSALSNLIHASDDHLSDLVQVLYAAAFLHRRQFFLKILSDGRSYFHLFHAPKAMQDVQNRPSAFHD